MLGGVFSRTGSLIEAPRSRRAAPTLDGDDVDRELTAVSQTDYDDELNTYYFMGALFFQARRCRCARAAF